MNNQNSAFNPPARKKKRQPVNFAEALKSIGGQTAKSIKDDLIVGVGQDAVGSVTGSPGSNLEQSQSPDQPSAEFIQNQEHQINQEAALRQRHKEVIAMPVYDRREEEIKSEITLLQEELKKLAQEIAVLGISTQKAVEEELVDPGTYHLGYFQKLRRFIVLLRKQVSESKNWLAVSYQRKQSQKAYWGGVKKSGTKFMLSQERYMATSAG